MAKNNQTSWTGRHHKLDIQRVKLFKGSLPFEEGGEELKLHALPYDIWQNFKFRFSTLQCLALVSKTMLKALRNSVLPNLPFLDLHELKMTIKGITLLSTLSNVRTLQMSDIGVLRPNFKHGYIYSRSYVSMNQYLSCLQPLIKLQTLDLHDCFGLTDAGVLALVHLTNLTHLDLSTPFASSITTEGLRPLQVLTGLEKLEIKGIGYGELPHGMILPELKMGPPQKSSTQEIPFVASQFRGIIDSFF